MKAIWKSTNGGSPGTRVFAAYVALVMLVAIIGPGLSVYAAEGDEVLVPEGGEALVPPAEESVAGVEIPSVEEAVVPAPEPQELEPAADAPEVTSAAQSVPTPEVFPAAVVSSAVDPVLSDDPNPSLSAGG
ncbi:hypothetical protein EG835_09790, partial [bacterium]|nr:hypothetical protein [bacterium]